MRHLPRLAVGTVQPQARREPLLWGLLAGLYELDTSPVLFRSSCKLSGGDPQRGITGGSARHLDSWAMSPRAAVHTLDRATGPRELAIVEGEFEPSQVTRTTPPASRLETLCDWLEVPRIAIVDVTKLAQCVLPPRPARLDGLLLDRVADEQAAAYWRTTLQALWNAPVLGWLDEVTPLRTLCETLPARSNPSRELCTALAAKLLPNLNVEGLLALAQRTPPLLVEPDDFAWSCGQRRFRIAVAYDEAYCGYYPETLDLLEAAGAELCDFSPLASGSIPAGVDIVFIGCGHPERHAAQLAGNHCLKQSLRCFAAAGGRIYAEGSGLAYLCRDVVFPCGNTVAMTGLLPATARWLPQSSAPEPTEVTFGATSWMVPSRTTLRGYRHPGWQIEPRGPMITYALDVRQRLDVLGRGNVVGSRVLFNLAANQHLLRRFFEPYAPVASSAHGE
jgi:cobyrinic acid a,c-diamide synthase